MTTQPTAHPTAPPPTTTSARWPTTLLALVVPLALLGSAAVVAISWRGELPDPVATHWGSHGPDGFESLSGALVPLLLGAVLAALGWAVAFFWGRDTGTRRTAVGTSLGLAVLLGTVTVGSLAVQRGLDDARDAPGVGGLVLVGTLAGLALGIGAAFLVPRVVAPSTHAPVDPLAPRVALEPSERAAWSGSVRGASVLMAGILGVALCSFLATREGLALAALLMAPVVALVVTALVWRVTVDQRGLEARPLLGWPRVHVPLDEVERAVVVQVHPLTDFGGWGYRIRSGGRTGVVVRGGEAVEVHRTGGRSLVVTVDDAATAAGLLNTLADRARA